MMNKNEIYETVVLDISDTGMGIGRVNGMAVFIKGAAVGDRALVKITKVQKNCAFAIIEEMLDPSVHRVENDCESFPRCGGCALRNIDYDFELCLKQKGVFETMRRIGGVNKEPECILSADPYAYRNKAQFPIGEGGAGFYAPHSHRIVGCENCRILPAEFSVAANKFYRFLVKNNISIYNEQSSKGLVRHLFLRKGFSTGEVQAAIVINGEDIPKKEEVVALFTSVFGDRLKSVVLNQNKKDNNVILGDKNKTIYGSPYITDVLCGVKVRLSVNSFYQVNSAAAELLYKKAIEYAEPDGKTVLDLYCGAGTIGLSMAQKTKQIIGVEIVPAAVEDAIHNAKQNNINNARFICADAAKAAKTLSIEGVRAEVVILDPPRKGCEKELLYCVANDFAPKRIVYVSCDKATLARDIKILADLGFTLKEYTPVDMFPRTAHVETVACLLRE